ncbi:MAG: helix-turn-helix domain-containing protein [Acetobacteraceae bacterium]|nr:helix-turn-helix domain-containing protein [Acetobacteraceae bacterium]
MELKLTAEILAAIAQETRLDLLRQLIAAPSGMAAGDLAAALHVPASTLSFHLAALERVGMIFPTRHGRSIIHAVRPGALRGLIRAVTELCGGDLSHLPTPANEDDRMIPAFNVLFVCTHNAARSIMAESILTKIGAGRFHAYSAGSAPGVAPLPAVITKLASLGHDVSRLASKSWDRVTGPAAPRMDFVIALCDTLAGQSCPDFGALSVTGAWPLPDPAKFHGNPAEQATMLNEVYASLRRRIEIFMSLPFATLDRMALKARLDEIGVGMQVA